MIPAIDGSKLNDLLNLLNHIEKGKGLDINEIEITNELNNTIKKLLLFGIKIKDTASLKGGFDTPREGLPQLLNDNIDLLRTWSRKYKVQAKKVFKLKESEKAPPKPERSKDDISEEVRHVDSEHLQTYKLIRNSIQNEFLLKAIMSHLGMDIEKTLIEAEEQTRAGVVDFYAELIESNNIELERIKKKLKAAEDELRKSKSAK